MLNVNLDKLISLSKTGKFNDNKSKFFLKKGIDSFAKMNNSKNGILYLPVTVFYAISGLLAESKEIKAKKEALVDILSFPKEKITGDLTNFIESKGSIEAYVNDLQYDIGIPDSSIKNLQILWGDAYFEKLHDFSKLERLEAVVGDIYISEGKNAEQLERLELITGNIYIKNNKKLEDSKKRSLCLGQYL